MCLTLGAVVVAPPGTAVAVPSEAVNSAGDVVSDEQVAKDAEGRTLVYVEGAREGALRAAVAKAGGVVVDGDPGRVKAAVAQDKLDLVASQPGVVEVRLPDRAVPMAVTSEGVGLSSANLWIQDGKRGAGVKVGIIDVGFGGLAQAQAAGELPPTGAKLKVDDSDCYDASLKTEHGTNVAEVVHDMAPDAELHLACVEDTVSFSAAAEKLRAQGVQVITAAIGFLSPTGGRGDGSGPAGSPADVVKRSREAGILWTVAAGNQARLHFAGKAADASRNGWVEFRGATENNAFTLQAGAKATIGLRWDAWPTTTEDLDLYVMSEAHPPTGPNDPAIKEVSTRSQKDSAGGLSPTEELTFANNSDPAGSRTYYVYVKNNNARFTTPFELFASGPTGQLQFYTEEGSTTEPATSPYVLAVGATEPGTGVVENFSGRGPTVDGRQKPDLVGFDRVSTSTWGGHGFIGTSAAAAHVAGAAALLKSANPQLDAAQLQSALQAKASPKKADNTWGSGTLNLGTPDTVPSVVGSGFTAAPTQERIHSQPYSAGQVVTLPLPGVPGDTTAVALTVSARSDVETTFDFFPGDPATSASKATGLKVRGGNTFTSLTVFAPVGADRAIRIRNRTGSAFLVVEFLGYFSPGQSTDTYVAKPSAQRVLDTRGFAGSPRSTPLLGGDIQEVPIRGVADVPSTATAVVVNLTGFEATRESFLLAYGANNTGTTSLVLATGERRSNLAVVPIAEDGKIRLRNQTGGGSAGVAVDVVGWFGPGSGARYVTLPEAARLADTATGTGLPKAPVGQGAAATVQVGGVAGVSAAATTAALTVTGVENGLGTDLSVRATEVGWSRYTDVSTRKAEPMAGLVLAPLGVLVNWLVLLAVPQAMLGLTGGVTSLARSITALFANLGAMLANLVLSFAVMAAVAVMT
ncbi:MAG: S8 family serine peptidase, partial [Umezawaea sp.]